MNKLYQRNDHKVQIPGRAKFLIFLFKLYKNLAQPSKNITLYIFFQEKKKQHHSLCLRFMNYYPVSDAIMKEKTVDKFFWLKTP